MGVEGARESRRMLVSEQARERGGEGERARERESYNLSCFSSDTF